MKVLAQNWDATANLESLQKEALYHRPTPCLAYTSAD